MSLVVELTTGYIREFAEKKGINFVGVASADSFDGVSKDNHPRNLFKEVQSVIVCGKVVPTGSLFVPPTLYHNTVNTIYGQLNMIALEISEEIENHQGMAVPVPAHGPFEYWDEKRQYARGDISIKRAAELAGLGKIGKSSIFISKDYGVLCRMVCILTNVELEPTKNSDWEPCPDDCELCMNACPVGAIKPGKVCEQSLCRQKLFHKTQKGAIVESCRECLKACPWVLKRANHTVNQECVRTFNVDSILNKVEESKKVVISTLGPSGTCSEYASQFYLNKNNYNGEIILCPSFEEAVQKLKDGQSDYVVIPSAYQNFATIVFQGKQAIEVADVFKLTTPSLVIANTGGIGEVKKVATHASPSSLARIYYPDAELVITKSNSDSADKLLAGEVDACLTTMRCVDLHGLNIVHDFGSIAMGWNVLEKIK